MDTTYRGFFLQKNNAKYLDNCFLMKEFSPQNMMNVGWLKLIKVPSIKEKEQ
jgi:hypothetical protein